MIFQSKNMAFLPNCLYHVQFPSSTSYSFQSIDLWPPKVGLFLKYFILFDVMVKGIASLLCLSALPLLVYKMIIYLFWMQNFDYLSSIVPEFKPAMFFQILGPIVIIYICLTNQQLFKLYLHRAVDNVLINLKTTSRS